MFFPLRGDECSVDHISRFQSIILCCTSAWPPSAFRGALRHADTLASPVDLQVVVGKPQVSDDDGLLPEICNCEVHLLCVLAVSEYDLNLLCDGSILIQSPIDIVDWDWVW